MKKNYMGDTQGKTKNYIQNLGRETQGNESYETSTYVCMYMYIYAHSYPDYSSTI
jgi:hypothetical protein